MTHSRMPVHLESDARTVDALVAILTGLAKAGVSSEQFINHEFSEELREHFNSLMKRAYVRFELDTHIDSYTFWGILESLILHGYDELMAKPDHDSAISLLKAVSINLQQEIKPKLVLVPLR